MPMDRQYAIYCHTTPSGKRYIGQTVQEVQARWKYGDGYKESQYFHNAIEKYGWKNIEHTVLCWCSSKEHADFLEKWFIRKYDTFNREHGYNLTEGGAGSPKRTMTERGRNSISKASRRRAWTDEQRESVSRTLKRKFASGELVREPMSDEAREKQRAAHLGPLNPNYGKPRSMETREKIRAAHLGKSLSDEHRKKISESHRKSDRVHRKAVSQFTLDGEYVNSYASMMEAQRQTGILSASISCCCRGKSHQSGGFIWCLQDKPETFPSPKPGLFS